MYKETVVSDSDVSNDYKKQGTNINGSKLRFTDIFSRAATLNRKNIFNHLTGVLVDNCTGSKITELKDCIKITYREQNNFTVIHLFFEKSKVLIRHNLKSFDHLIMTEPNLEFIELVLKEIKQLGYHQFHKENDELQSTCRIELIKEN